MGTRIADRVIEASKKKSEELLNEVGAPTTWLGLGQHQPHQVHEQIKSLTSDLDQSTAEQKKDLDLLKQDEDYQDK